MAQDTKPPTHDDDEAHLHSYSGGEVKELAGTRVAPALWIFYGLLVAGAIAAIFWLGALGPYSPTGTYKPPNGSYATLTSAQSILDQHTMIAGMQSANRLDLSRILLPQGETLPKAIDAGSDVYQTYCIGCHGPNQDGNGVNAASLNPKPRNLHDAPFMQAMSYQRIYTSVHKGVPGTAMPRWENSLTETQLRDVIAYVLSLTTPTAPAATSNNAAGGHNQFTGQSAQNSPTPITPPINGNAAAETSTAPPSSSGQPNMPASTTGKTASPAQPGSAKTVPTPGVSAKPAM